MSLWKRKKNPNLREVHIIVPSLFSRMILPSILLHYGKYLMCNLVIISTSFANVMRGYRVVELFQPGKCEEAVHTDSIFNQQLDKVHSV